MADAAKWEISEDYPDGRAVPLTEDEAAQLVVDQAASAARAAEPVPPTLTDEFNALVDAVLNAPDFDTAKKTIATLKKA